ncbi:hypothetical protein [Candidatus Nitrospira salsa]
MFTVVRNILAVLLAFLCMPVLVILGVVALPFWLVSFMTQAMTSVAQRKSSSWDAIIQFDSSIGWKVKPHLDTYYLALGDDVCHVMTDSQGWVGTPSLSESNLVVFGDSYAFAYGVDVSEAYFNLNPQLRIKAICAPGYDMVQELLLMKKYSPELANKLVVWFVCLENDLHDNLKPNSQHPQHVYRTPFVRSLNGDMNWEIVTSHVSNQRWPYPTLKTLYAETFAKLCTPSPFSQHTYSACEYLLKEGRDVCGKVGAQLAIVAIPNKLQLSERGVKSITSKLSNGYGFDPHYPDQQFSEMCHRLTIPFFSAKSYLQLNDYKQYDWHWAKQGHRQISSMLGDLYAAYASNTLLVNHIPEHPSK